jgi:hypothetical protein
MKTQIRISEVLDLLAQGYTRTKDTKKYNPEIGSVEEYYNLTPADVKHLFTHPKLVGRKTLTPKVFSFEIEDDTIENNIAELAEEVSFTDVVDNNETLA